MANGYFGNYVAITKDDVIVVAQRCCGDIFLFSRNTTGSWVLVDQLFDSAYFPKLSGNFLAVIKKNVVSVYKVNGTTGISTALHNFTGPEPSVSSDPNVNRNPMKYDLTEDGVVIGEGTSKMANVYPMKSGIQIDILNASSWHNGSEFGRHIKMFKKVKIISI